MRILLALVTVAMLSSAALPSSEATGGNQTFRIVTSIDALLVGLSSSCPNTYNAPPTFPINVPCSVVKAMLGYDGISGASTAIPDHVNHGFACSITGQAAPPAAGLPTDPSFWVGFDTNADGQSDIKYGGRTTRPGLGQVTGELQNRVLAADVVGVATFPLWYAGQISYNGPSSSVSGNVDHQQLIIWLESGLDATIVCGF